MLTAANPMSGPPESCLLCEIEGRKIHAAIFGRAIPPALLDRFVPATKRLNAAVGQAEMDRCYRAILDCDDLEALELAGRYTRQFPLLTRKFRLMAHLAETVPETQAFFVAERSDPVAGLGAILIGGLRTAARLVSGLWLLRRYAHG